MGCSCSKSQPTVAEPCDVSVSESRIWRKVKSLDEAKSSFEAEGNVVGEADRSQVECRALLDYPIGRQCLMDYLKLGFPPFVETCLLGWIDIQTFNKMVPGDGMRSMGLSIHWKWVQGSELISETLQRELSKVVACPEFLVRGVFRGVQAVFFELLHNNLFVKFRQTTQYQIMCSTLRRKYNRVKQNDFLYHQLVGQGGFGLVCEVSKKSTGMRYAMKLQRKVHMIDIFGEEPCRVNFEKRAFASCHHPFIVELFFAFQTEALVIMVISLGTGRDLSKILRASGPLTIEQAMFYSAEITSALSYLHSKGMVYRDLKPGNVLLNMDGHIQLVDFGGVCDVNGKLLAPAGEPTISPVFNTAPMQDNTIPPLSLYWSNPLSGNAVDCTASSFDPDRRRTISECTLNLPVDGGETWCGVDNNVLVEVPAGIDLALLRSKCISSPSIVRALQKKFYELTEADILRHLIICDGDYELTVNHLKMWMLWRQNTFASPEMPRNTTAGPGCWFYVHGCDVHGHPLLIFTTRMQDSNTRNIDESLRWFTYMLEMAVLRLPPHLEQVTVLVNRLGMSQRVDFELAKQLIPIYEQYYPHRVHKLLVYPVSPTLRTILGLIKRLSGKLSEYVEFVSSLDALREVVPDEFIPSELGGSCSYVFDSADYPAPVLCAAYERFNNTSVSSDDSVQEERERGRFNDASLTLTSKGSADDTPEELQRANSIVGTYSYMAPEMMVLMMRAPGFKHTGYTKAVDWWSLGVSLYRLLTGEYPFDTEIPTPSTPAAMLTEGSDRYTVLLEKVDYAPLVLYPDAVDFVSKLLTVDDTKRMGYGPSGSIAVSSHPFYRSINWVDLEKKMSQPPPLPTSCAPHRAWRDPTTLENVLQLYKRNEWLDPPNRVSMTNLQRLREDALNAELEFWDYTSPSAVLAELGENTMEDT